MADTLEHLTLTSGHTRRSPRAEVEDRTIAFIRDCLVNQGGVLGDTGWRVVIVPMTELSHSHVFELWHSGQRLVACYLCSHSTEHDGMWGAIKEAQIPTVGRAAKEPTVPWLSCAVVGSGPPSVMMEAGDLERCVAWTLME